MKRLLLLLALCACSQREARPLAAVATPPAAASRWDPADVKRRALRWATVPFSADMGALGAKERAALRALKAAADAMDRVYWKQVDPEALTLRAEIGGLVGPDVDALRHLFEIHYGPYDQLDRQRSFYGTRKHPEGGAFYPPDVTKAEVQSAAARLPAAERARFEGPYTRIERRGGTLVAVPYSLVYREELEPAAKALEEAAGLVPSPSLQRFLRLRAQAFRSNDYHDSEVAWIEVDSRLEVMIGPEETYDDALLGWKASFSSVLGVRHEAMTQRLAAYAQHLPAIDRALPYTPPGGVRKSTRSPIVVIDQLYATGDSRKGMQGMAFTLPNDERIQREKGSRKVLKRNVGHARFFQVALPIAQRLLDPAQAARATFDAFFLDTLMHELCHGLGPSVLRKNGRETTVEKELAELASPLEEAKADMAGLVAIYFLLGKGVVTPDVRAAYPASVLASILRTVRLGADEDHGRSNLLELNYFQAEGAVRFDHTRGRYVIDESRFEAAGRKLAGEILAIQAAGDYARAKALLERYAHPTPELKRALVQVEDVPVDFVPSYTLAP